MGQILKVYMMKFAMRIWVYTKGLRPLKDFGLYSPWTSLWSHSKCRVPWSFGSHDLMPLMQTYP